MAPKSTLAGSDPYADRRAHPRVEIALAAFLQANGERHSVQLIDLSAGGAKLVCTARLPMDTSVTLDCGTFRLRALVRWQNDGFLGLSFDSALDQREVAALVARSNAVAARMTVTDK
jgi:hypothetical protein